MTFQGPRLPKCLAEHLAKASQTAKHCIKSGPDKHMKTHAEKLCFQLPKASQEGIHFQALGCLFHVIVRLGAPPAPSWRLRWPRSTKACQNHIKKHLKHAEVVKKRILQDHVGPESDNSCLLLFFSGSPRTSKNVADISSPWLFSPGWIAVGVVNMYTYVCVYMLNVYVHH